MKTTRAFCCMVMAVLGCKSDQAVAAVTALPLVRISREQLCVTNGSISTLADGHLAIDTPSSRAVVRTATTQAAEIRFRYLGPSAAAKPLASGEMRRQIGLKLRAQDSCNLVYAMWHIEPDSKIAVSIKRNLGKHSHEQCHADGYTTITPRQSVAMPRVSPGDLHVFRAELRVDNLTITADGIVVWQGPLGHAISEFDGPVGFRTDNARFEFEYLASPQTKSVHSTNVDERLNRCVSGPGD